MKKVREESEAADAPEPGPTAMRRRMLRELVELALELSDAIDAATTSLDDRADYTLRLDRMYAAAGGISMVHLARMRLLEAIGRSIAVEPVVVKSHKIRHALARRELGEALSDEESELLSSEDPEVVRETKELEGLMDTSDPKHHETFADWLSTIAAVGSGLRDLLCRARRCRASWICCHVPSFFHTTK